MAERRMFAKTIIDSDAFLDMPLSTQSLYFHLSMRADDEGFINNPKKIQKVIGATEDDLKLLIAKSFIIPFESGVVVIKHWKIHNYIRGDRLVKTQYKDEKALLSVKENGAYTIAEDIKEIQLLDAKDKRKLAYQNSSLPYSFTYKIRRAFDGCTCPSCGQKMTSRYKTSLPTVQHNIPISKGGEHEIDNISVICASCNASIRDKETEAFNNAEVIEKWDKIRLLEKQGIEWFYHTELLDNPIDSQMSVRCQSDVSIGKDSIGKDSIGYKENYQKKAEEVAAYWNEKAKTCSIRPMQKLTGKRITALKERLKDYSVEDMNKAIDRIVVSDFCNGKGERGWKADIDFLLRPDTITKILEGKYDNQTTTFASYEQRTESDSNSLKGFRINKTNVTAEEIRKRLDNH